MEVSITGHDLKHRALMDKMRGRLLVLSLGFFGLFFAISMKLAIATVFLPLAPEKRQIAPQVPPIPESDPKGKLSGDFASPQVKRASILDRNGQILAISLPVAQVYANPQELIDPQEIALKLQKILPNLDIEKTVKRLSSNKKFVYIARDITPAQEIAINDLGIPGIYFEAGERRHYPLGTIAAHILGTVDIDDQGVAGIERFFNARLNSDHNPLRLSIDVRVQTVVRNELFAAKELFKAIGASAIVMDVNTGEIISMVSLPDYDANDFNHATPDSRFNRATTGLYEPGSTFKLQTAAMALQLGVAHIWDKFSTIPIHVGRFTISDLKVDHFAPWLSLPEVMAYSSNPAAAHIALDVGAERQRAWLKTLGFFDRVPIELPETARPLIPSKSRWGISTVMTVGFGHGVAEPPLAIVRGTAATVNGGFLVKPTLISKESAFTSPNTYHPEISTVENPSTDTLTANTQIASLSPPAHEGSTRLPQTSLTEETPDKMRVISEENSKYLRQILRLVVTKGIGKSAESPGYFVGGKTGTAEKIGPHGGYLKHVNISAFTGVFPMNAPRYTVYVMLDSPKPTPATHGWTTAGWNAAPTVSKIVSRIGPILGMFPNTKNPAAVDAALAMPLRPPVPKGIRALGPGNDPGDPRNAKRSLKNEKRKPHSSKPEPKEAMGKKEQPTPRTLSQQLLSRHNISYQKPPDD
ncbi:Penicillin binding protein transpeptidase domain protein [Entomobacter blattae]|uniref:Penicillin binding protein transpeptidase domain protein n=2 Tax=Entomobacter blattae TaxID=2762277 RepID=A0A7H1NNR4_9PROT|nr:Penicillin binding protein transpeptidase domain protein [Entomobacter blattae]